VWGSDDRAAAAYLAIRLYGRSFRNQLVPKGPGGRPTTRPGLFRGRTRRRRKPRWTSPAALSRRSMDAARSAGGAACTPPTTRKLSEWEHWVGHPTAIPPPVITVVRVSHPTIPPHCDSYRHLPRRLTQRPAQ